MYLLFKTLKNVLLNIRHHLLEFKIYLEIKLGQKLKQDKQTINTAKNGEKCGEYAAVGNNSSTPG